MRIEDVKSKKEMREVLESQNYIASEEIVHTVFNAMQLDMPILIEGPAGVGKTELAKVLEGAFGLELLRVQCYEGQDFSKVLYEWDYSKQMLIVQMMQTVFKDKLEGLELEDAIKKIGGGSAFYNQEFLLDRPLLESITSDTRKVLLIDELDKSDEEFEALLLEFLGEFSITIPGYKTVECPEDKKPIVILTSNSQRELSEALKRRCAYLYIDYPSEAVETRIIKEKANVDNDFAKKVATAVARIRSLDRVKQKPSVAESVAWAKSLVLNLGVEKALSDNKEDVDLTLNILLKNKKDIDIAIKSGYLANL
jgi:MoxR-like ATPase